MKRAFVIAGLVALFAAGRAETCKVHPGFATSLTFREEVKQGGAKVVLHGTIGDVRSKGQTGESDFHIKSVLHSDPAIKGVTKIVLPRSLPVADKKSPPHYVVFADIDRKTLDPYRGVLITGKQASADYVKKALALKGNNRVAHLRFFFTYLEDADAEVARDAFLELTKAKDDDLALAASRFDAAKVRGWLKSDKVPAYRLSQYALLLGMCGQEADAAFLQGLLDNKAERYVSATDGVLAGSILLDPKAGWSQVQRVLADNRKSLVSRLGALRTVRYFYQLKPKESRAQVVKTLKATLAASDLADLAAEDLRRMQIWDLTAEVLKQYRAKETDFPVMRRAIIRYALAVPAKGKEVQAFLKARRLDDAKLVQEAEELLQAETDAAKPKDEKKTGK